MVGPECPTRSPVADEFDDEVAVVGRVADVVAAEQRMDPGVDLGRRGEHLLFLGADRVFEVPLMAGDRSVECLPVLNLFFGPARVVAVDPDNERPRVGLGFDLGCTALLRLAQLREAGALDRSLPRPPAPWLTDQAGRPVGPELAHRGDAVPGAGLDGPGDVRGRPDGRREEAGEGCEGDRQGGDG